MPDNAGFPAPVTPTEKSAVAAYATWLSEFGRDNRTKTERLRSVQRWCSKR